MSSLTTDQQWASIITCLVLFALYPHLLYRLCNDGWWIDAIYYLHPQCVAEEMDEISGMERGMRKIETGSGTEKTLVSIKIQLN